VIDLGSNTARCVVFEASQSRTVRAVFETKEAPRLGLDTRHDGSLSPAAVARGLTTVRKFARTLRSLEVPRTIGVATSAVRDAPNGPAFVRRVEASTDLELRILSGAEEARYAYLGVAGWNELAHDLVCDLGGGSLQLIRVRDGAPDGSVSLPLGSLRLSRRFLDHDPPKHRELDRLRTHVRKTVREAVKALGGRAERLFGLGGTVRSLARASIELRQFPVRRVHGYRLYGHDLEALDELLGPMPAAKRRSIPGIGGDRADVVLAGLVVLEELMRAVGTEATVVSGAGIREGIALEAIGATLPAPSEELVERSVSAAAEALSFRRDHGEEITRAALALFDLLAPRHGWGRSERLALRAAGGMHDAGISVDLWNHAQHASYLLQNYPVAGLDPREVVLAAMGAYLHEGGEPPSEWKRRYLPLLQPSDLELAVQLGAVLEVAELVAPARPRFRLARGGRTLAVGFSAGSGSALPSRWLEKAGKPLQRVFDLEVAARER
jgi:exopolyphosphatase / guanosine-5'-triphosphate,3'-diphosphate pyrophosphatase